MVGVVLLMAPLARDAERGRQAAAEIGARFVQLDVTDDASVRDALAAVDAAEGRLDVLVNNAGVLGDGPIDGPAALRVFDVGSCWAVTNPDRPESGLPLTLYAASKTAATMLTVQYAKAHAGIQFNAVEPGPTATDMTAAFGIGRPVAESARIVVRPATLGQDGPTGTLQDEAGSLPW